MSSFFISTRCNSTSRWIVVSARLWSRWWISDERETQTCFQELRTTQGTCWERDEHVAANRRTFNSFPYTRLTVLILSTLCSAARLWALSWATELLLKKKKSIFHCKYLITATEIQCERVCLCECAVLLQCVTHCGRVNNFFCASFPFSS